MLSFPLTVPQRRVAGAALACLVLAVVVLRQQGGGGSPPLRVAPLAPAAPARSSVGGRAIVVDVVGAVAHPGLYHLPQRSRVADAVARAGGLTRRAERAAVNLAAPIADGQQILVAARGSPTGAAGAVGSSATANPVSLSSATAEQLDTLPGVGPVTAQKIVAYRQEHGPFTSVEALDAIAGIGPARLADLKGLVVP
jgi:competence protein ComEA